MSKIITTIIVIIIFYNFSFAISVKDIPPVYVSSYTIDDLLEKIHYSVEPFASDWSKDWKHPIKKQLIWAQIDSVINQLNSRVWAEDLWTIYFTQALLWHYFYQLENEKGYFVCDSICKIIQKEFPKKYEAFWLYGVNKIKAGRVAEGFAVLDSLYSFSNVSSSFVNEYSQLSRKCFVVKNSNDYNFNQNEFYFSPKETKPILSLWESDEKDEIISFIFTEKYMFIENFQIKYPKLYNENEYKFNLGIDEKFLKEIKIPALWEPNKAALHPAVYKITIDRSRQNQSLFEYLLSIVYNRFDFVSEIKPPFRKNAISVRGGQYNVIRGVSGKSVIYTLYDYETDGNSQQFFTTKNTTKGIKPMKIRILVSLETTQKAEPKALNFYHDIVNGIFIW
ncbi:MAG: hypothetical protein LBH98_08200 [Chitinispirillales bacterium]|jgi:hypothetical protein|nr:hypothetical protein [Chitinispirillales bacterium]